MNGDDLLWGLLFGSIGMGYAIYGRKQQRFVALLAGLGLMGLPYLVDGTLPMLIGGAVLLALPFLLKM